MVLVGVREVEEGESVFDGGETRLRDGVCVEQGLGADGDGVEGVVSLGARESGVEVTGVVGYSFARRLMV